PTAKRRISRASVAVTSPELFTSHTHRSHSRLPTEALSAKSASAAVGCACSGRPQPPTCAEADAADIEMTRSVAANERKKVRVAFMGRLHASALCKKL